jgi:hypothetical protein
MTKTRKRARRVLHPIATDTDIGKDETCSSSSSLADNLCATPARRARLLNTRTLCFHF